MSAAHLSSFMQEQDVLGELLHSVSQPLTSLRCSLELSLDEVAEQQQEAIGIALQQTEHVIGMIQLMREYLDAELPNAQARRVSIESVLRKTVDDLVSIAEVRQITLLVKGTCSATVPLAEPPLQLALQYLISALWAQAGSHSCIVLRLEEGSTESALHAASVGSRAAEKRPAAIDEMMGRARLAVARRILESAGMWLTMENDDHTGFLLHIPRMLAASRTIV